MLKKIKEYKIYIAIIGFIAIFLKAINYGKNKVLFKQSKQNIKDYKKYEEIDNVIDNANDNELSKLL
ncbi:hypothetical protein KAH94_03150 [bacterium]|nr:hypothetical protein [bacterium]